MKEIVVSFFFLPKGKENEKGFVTVSQHGGLKNGLTKNISNRAQIHFHS